MGASEYYLYSATDNHPALAPFATGALVAEVILGFLTFTGSLMAAGKLMEIIPTRPITYTGQNVINLSLLAVAVLAGVLLVIFPGCWPLFLLIILISLAFGVMLIMPIGGADMPTVIAHLEFLRRAFRRGHGLRAATTSS